MIVRGFFRYGEAVDRFQLLELAGGKAFRRSSLAPPGPNSRVLPDRHHEAVDPEPFPEACLVVKEGG